MKFVTDEITTILYIIYGKLTIVGRLFLKTKYDVPHIT